MVDDDAFGHWLAGFIDGEGCFCLFGRRRCTPAFQLCLRDDDCAILVEIAQRTGIGRINARRCPSLQTMSPHYQTMWSVASKVDCCALVMLLTRYPLRAKKARDFAVWARLVYAWRDLQRLPRQPGQRGSVALDWTPVLALAEELRRVRAYDGADMARIKPYERTAAVWTASNAKLSEEQVLAIRRVLRAQSETHEALARRYGVRARTIGAIASRRTWMHLADEFEEEEAT